MKQYDINPLRKGWKSKRVKAIDVDFIVHTYRDALNVNVARFFRGIDQVYIHECLNTGYRFYYPFHILGDASFYEDLQKFDWYYMPWKWEHQKVKECIEALKKDNLKILEIGCARGDFLSRMQSEGHSTTGLELNRTAAQEAQRKGVRVLPESIEEHAQQHIHTYDVVCSFQVMEHIANIGEVIDASLSVLKPGGRLFISVPNNDSFLSLDMNVLNMPPHHMGLWNARSLQALASFWSLKIENMYFEPLQPYHQAYYKKTMDFHLYGTYAKSLYQKYGILGKIFYRLFRRKFMNEIERQYPTLKNFTVIAEYSKV
ncbi:2-polyprenyl-3-methyl-5-hydroxy-6-metoxy-1,4-benzoquinol methylase [Thermonema lapsum]|uniref:2-polyprenyl-3-methyl-5-hydroxy-6-metoxy-1, 4-benzoquinol methylase n=1 Tax=Thermonema lapsum TaxID=28195 RepID=A0A846MMD2_9BACT|nr:methyltransferase domain-containing protein [Thermonema lapsum]NIK72698.1 2-polyprenyl-3-methyl-5-hydroxy-6-metoxy-1,4-benzoquinol methylase [Thermonema lapsum]